MAEFAYTGRTGSGSAVDGRMEAESPDAVATRLAARGITPIDIRASASQAPTVGELWRRLGGDRPSAKDMLMFARQMHTITRSGLPLIQAMRSLAASTHNPVLREALGDVVASLHSGRTLSAALARHPRVFPHLVVALVEVGEATGTLDTAFNRIYEYLELERQIQDRVRAATRYPVIVLAAIAIAIWIVTVFVIPNFAPVFRALGDDIPLPTRIIIGVSDFTQHHGLLVLIALGLLAAGLIAWVRTEVGRKLWDRWRLRLPVVGPIMSDAALARITRSLAIALEAGLPINTTLSTIAHTTGNVCVAASVLDLREGVERGESLGQTASQAELFPPLVLQMIAVGEETGALPELLDEVAGYYEREVDYRLENLSAALEPLLIVAVGACVAVLALGVFLPMWDLIAKAKGF